MKKLILRANLCPGDILTMTAAVESLHLTYPDEYETDVRTSAREIWEQEGFPESKHEEHYYRAKQILEKQEVTSSKNFELPPPVINLPPLPKKRKSPTRRKKT